MQTPSESGHATPFQDWLERIARPIEFASRDECAHLGAVKNLSTFVATQVLSALARQVYPKAVEARLVTLRDLFIDFQQTLPLDEQRRRLQIADAIVKALRSAARQQSKPSGEESEQVVTELRSDGGGRRDLWNLPIRFVKGVGPKRTGLLQRLRIETVEDALWTILGVMKIGR